MLRKKNLRALVTVSALLSVSGSVNAADTVRSGTGADTAALQAIVDAFRGDIGGALNTTPGIQPDGRREINWDGVPAGQNTPNNFDGNFFNQAAPAGRARGSFFTTPGTSLQVSNDAFAAIDASYATEFTVFSPPRLFASLGSNIVDVFFSVPGSPSTVADTNAFGVIFTDVDLANTTSVEYFDTNDQSLGEFFAPTLDKGLSFLGVTFDTERIGRVRITSGNTPLAPGVVDGGGTDVVAMDDFIYSEPRLTVAAPEPATLALLLIGGGIGIYRRRRLI